MLTEWHRQLLTGYVDGELPPRQRRSALRLLRRSRQARLLLRRLQADARTLRSLPRLSLGADFADTVLQEIAQRKTCPPTLPLPEPASKPVPAWYLVAAAASVLLLVGLGSFLAFSQLTEDGRPSEPVVNNPAPQEPAQPVPPEPAQINGKPLAEKTPKEPDQEPVKPIQPEDRAIVKDKPRQEPGPQPTPEQKEPFRDVAMPLPLKLLDLQHKDARDKVLAELGKQTSLYAEVLYRDGTAGFARLERLLRARGIEVIVDPALQRARPGQVKNFLVYLEDMTWDELFLFFTDLGRLDQKASLREKASFPFASTTANLWLCQMTSDHRRRLVHYLGLDPRAETQTRGEGPLGVDIRRPLSEQTAEQLDKKLGSGRKLEDRRSALVVGYSPLPPRSGSAEIKRYLDGRKSSRPGTLQVMLILRARLG